MLGVFLCVSGTASAKLLKPQEAALAGNAFDASQAGKCLRSVEVGGLLGPDVVEVYDENVPALVVCQIKSMCVCGILSQHGYMKFRTCSAYVHPPFDEVKQTTSLLQKCFETATGGNLRKLQIAPASLMQFAALCTVVPSNGRTGGAL